MNLLKMFFSNKVFLYMASRYATYAVQFVVSLYIAARLGPYYMGIWGVILMIVQYFRLANFGIPISGMVLNVQYKSEERVRKDYETNSLFLVSCLGLIPIVVGFLYYITDSISFDKYELDDFFFYICLLGVMSYFVDFYSKIFITKGSLFEVAYTQSVIPFLTLVVLFVSREKVLVYLLIAVHIMGSATSILFFVKKNLVSLRGHLSGNCCVNIVKKGFYLFIYNTSFYLILLTTKTFISVNYSVKEFGFFSFAYTLTNAVLLLLEAFSSLITPKLIDKMNTSDINAIKKSVYAIRVNYVYLSHGLMYLAIPLFPLLLELLPAYQPALVTINLTALTLVLYTNSYGYISLLMAKNKEKVLARLSLTALVINIVLLYTFINIIEVSYQYAILATMGSYFIYALLCIIAGHSSIGLKTDFPHLLSECFPPRLLIPYIASIIIILYGAYWHCFIPLLLFCLLNVTVLKEFYRSFMIIIKNPNITDVK